MTTSRDPDRLIGAYLDEGPTVMPDRVLDAIRDDVDRTEQRAGFGPWRTLTMSRPLLAAAVIAALLVGLVAIYALLRPPSVGTDEPTPTPTPVPAAFPFDGDLEIGTTYLHSSFSEPLSLTVPASVSDGRIAGDYADSQSFRFNDFVYGVATFYDDTYVVDDLCNPTAAITIPATPQEIGTWLTDANGLTVSDPIELTVDGRTALVWDVEVGASCLEGDSPVSANAFWFQANEHHRIYAIPTGNDTILGVTWGGAYGGEGEEFLAEMNIATDDLVASMTFE